MSQKTKIIVLHMKEVIYTAVFLILAIILGIVIFFMFGSGKAKSSAGDSRPKYQPGIYNSPISLGGNTFDVEVTVDADRIRAVRLVNLSETTSAMFPLMEPALDSLAGQIYKNQSLENIDYPEEQKYTSMVLLRAIDAALEKAENP